MRESLFTKLETRKIKISKKVYSLTILSPPLCNDSGADKPLAFHESKTGIKWENSVPKYH